MKIFIRFLIIIITFLMVSCRATTGTLVFYCLDHCDTTNKNSKEIKKALDVWKEGDHVKVIREYYDQDLRAWLIIYQR